MLSPDEVQAARAKFNVTPVSPDAGASAPTNDVAARSAELDAAWGSTPKAPAIGDIGDTLMKSGSDFSHSFDDRGQEVEGAVERTATGKQSLAEGLGQVGGAVAGGVADIFGHVLNPIIKYASDKISDIPAVQKLAQTKVVGQGLDAVNNAVKHYEDFKQANPRAAADLESIVNVGAMLTGGESADAAGSAAKAAAEKAVTGAKPVASALLNAARDTANDTVAGVAEKAGPLKAVTKDNLKYGLGQTYGLGHETVDHILAHPEEYTPENMSTASRQALGDEVHAAVSKEAGAIPQAHDIAQELQAAAADRVAKISEGAPKAAELGEQVKDALITRKQQLRENAMKYPTGSLSGANSEKGIVRVDKNWLLDQLENKDVAGVQVEKDGRITHGDAYSKINPTDSPNGAQIFQNLWDTYGPEFAKGKMSRGMFIKFRQSLAGLANYRGGVDTVVEKAADAMRENLNKSYRSQIPGLKELDAKHTQMSRDFERLSKGMVTEDPLGRLNLQEGALQKITNATKDTKSETAKQLEELVPGITQKVKAMQDAETESGRITSGLIDEKGNLTEGSLSKIRNAIGEGKDVLALRLEDLVPGITEKIEKMRKFESDWKGVLNPDGSLADNALNTIANATNKGRDLRLDRLEQMVPGITHKIRFLKAVEDIQAAQGQKVGTYGRMGTLGLGSGMGAMAIQNPMILLNSAWLLPVLWYATNPSTGVKLLKAIGGFTKKAAEVPAAK